MPPSLSLCHCPCHYVLSLFLCPANYIPVSQSFSVPLSLSLCVCPCLYVMSLFLCPAISIPVPRSFSMPILYLCLYVSVLVTTFCLCFFVLRSKYLSLSLLCPSIPVSVRVTERLSLCLYPEIYIATSLLSLSLCLYLCLYVSVLGTTFPSLYLCPAISIPTSRFCRSLFL